MSEVCPNTKIPLEFCTCSLHTRRELTPKLPEQPKEIYHWPYCPTCKEPYEFDKQEPFAYCNCGSTEWGYPRPADFVREPMGAALERKLGLFIKHMTEVLKGQRGRDSEGLDHFLLTDGDLADWLDRLDKAGELRPPMFLTKRPE